jgi:hypothetical protein
VVWDSRKARRSGAICILRHRENEGRVSPRSSLGVAMSAKTLTNHVWKNLRAWGKRVGLGWANVTAVIECPRVNTGIL